MDNANKITINGRKYIIRKDDTILTAAQRNNIHIPTLCYLKDTMPTGACRICVVEIENAKNLAPACSTPVSPGMVVLTDSPAVMESRRQTVAFLMASGNHNS